LMCLLIRPSAVHSVVAGSASKRPQFDDRPDFFRLGSSTSVALFARLSVSPL